MRRTLLPFLYVDYSDEKPDGLLKFRNAVEGENVFTSRTVALVDMPPEWVQVAGPHFQFSVIGFGTHPSRDPMVP